MPRPLRVFLCHASQDKPTVWKLHRYLKQHGIKPWLDQEDLLPGEDWEVEIPRALFSSDVILVCLSKNSVNKEGFVQKEITFALDKAMEKPEGTIFIIPVKLEDCEIPRRLTRYQWVDLSRAEGRKRLLMGLNKRVTELGPDVSPVILDDTRRTTAPKTPKPETRKPEEQIVSVPVKEEIQEEPKKEIQAKPFTKFLDPSSLSPNEKSTIGSPVGRVSNPTVSTPRERQAKSLTYPVWAIAIFAVVVISLLVWGVKQLTMPRATPEPPQTDIAAFTMSPVATEILPTNTEPPAAIEIPPTFTLVPPTLTPSLGIGSLYDSNGVTMLYVPAGTFLMGSEVSSDEQPIHYVNLDAYYIDEYEVTNAAYKLCVDAGACVSPKQSNSDTRSTYYGSFEFNEYPVIYVDWNMAKIYCEWRDARLPTEAEWEKTARGTGGRTYPWGENIDCNKANYKSTCAGDTMQVGHYPDAVSFYGVYDMSGNVWEWVNDWYDESYYQSSPSLNPLGANIGTSRVLRGGSWYNSSHNTRSTVRGRDNPSTANSFIGFRCARSP